MKRILIVIALTVSTLYVSAQEITIVKYLFTSSEGSSVNLIQYLSNEKSLEVMVPKSRSPRDSIFAYQKDVIGNEIYKVYINSNPKSPFVYKNHNTEQLLLVDNLGFRDNVFLTDTLNNFIWKLHPNETKKIGEFNCLKATTKFRGRNYSAWFTNDLKIVSGPWKFGGLNGLIVEISDSDNYFRYQLTEVSSKVKSSLDVNIPEIYKNEKSITYKDYVIRKKIIKQDMENDSKPLLFNGVKHTLAREIELF